MASLGLRLFCVAVLILALHRSTATAGPPASDEAARRAREQAMLRGALKARVDAWLTARKDLSPKSCSNCNGKGYHQVFFAGGDGRKQSCSTCSGTGKAVSKTALQAVYVLSRSLARRAVHRDAPKTDVDGLALTSGRFDGSVVVDPTHAVVSTIENGATKTSRWILALESVSRPLRWFLYDEAVDGPWPAGAPPDSPPLSVPEPLPEVQGLALDAVLDPVRTSCRVKSRRYVERTLLLDLEREGIPSEETLYAEVRDDSIVLVRRIFGLMGKDWDAIRMTFTSLCQDRFGKRTQEVYEVVSATVDTYKRLHFENLTPDGVLATFTVSQPPLPEGVSRLYSAPPEVR